MEKLLLMVSLTVLALSCSSGTGEKQGSGVQSGIITEMIESVNEKNAEKYVSGFADNVEVYVDSELKVLGRTALMENRANHFKNHPNVFSEIQYLVEIDNKVIMHDKVWLDKSRDKASDIVEIFTFENNKVVRVDVIQPKDLFQ